MSYLENIKKRLWPFRRNKPQPAMLSTPHVPGAALPFNPVVYLQEETGYDKFLIFVISPISMIMSAYFTARLLTMAWGFESFMQKIVVVSIAILFTAGEINAFRAFIIKSDYRMLWLGLFVAICSVGGSFGAFQSGVYQNTVESDSYQMVKIKVKQLDTQIQELNKNLEHFRKTNQPGNIKDTNRELKATQVRRDSAYTTMKNAISEGTGEGNAMFVAMGETFGWTTDTTARRVNFVLSLLIELLLITSTAHKANQDLNRKNQVIAATSYEAVPRFSFSTGQAPKTQAPQAPNEHSSNEHSSNEHSSNEKSPNEKSANEKSAVGEDLDNPSQETLTDIIYHCLKIGKHPESARANLRGTYRFDAVRASLQRQGYRVSRQYVEKVFKRYWMHRQDNTLVPLVIERYCRDQPDVQAEDIARFIELTVEEVKKYL